MNMKKQSEKIETVVVGNELVKSVALFSVSPTNEEIIQLGRM